MLIQLSSLSILNRQRSEASLDKTEIGRLADSIHQKGLLHAVVVYRETPEGAWCLLAGHRRTLAITLLHTEGRSFFFNGEAVEAGTIPAVEVTSLSPADLAEAEFEENELRSALSWQDRARALSKIHELRVASNPTQTFSETGAELASKSAGTLKPDTLRKKVQESIVISQHLHKPSIAKARNAEEAYALIMRDEGAKLERELIARRLKAAPTTPDILVRHGDALKILPQMDEGLVDLILVDPPYGISANTGGFRDRTVHHHNYEDTPEVARELLLAILSEGFRLTKPKANLFCFGDIDLFPLFKERAAAMGWTPFRTPITWQKSESEGLAPWGRQGFRRTCEWIFYATKGAKGLLESPVDILNIKRVNRSERVYGPQKPIELMELLIRCTTMPGDLILDPCCGSGASLAAARRLKRRAIGIELDDDAYSLSVIAAERDEEKAEETQIDLEDVL